MKTLKELNFIKLYAKSWNNLDSEVLDSLLSNNVVYESQNVFTALNGKADVMEYFRGKMTTLKRAGNEHKVYAEIGFYDRFNGRYVTQKLAGRPVVILSQGTKDVPIALVLLEVVDNLIERIDICSVAPHPLSAFRTGEYPQ